MTLSFSNLLESVSLPKGHAGPPLNCPRCGRFLARSGSKAIASPNHWDGDENWGECRVHGWQEWSS